MPNIKGAEIIFDGSPLRYLHTGLGQFSYHLIQELVRLNSPFNFTFLVHPSARIQIQPFTNNLADINWLRRHVPEALLPLFFKKYDLWHATSENTRIRNFSKSTRVLVTLHGLHFLDEDPPEKAKEKLKQVQRLVDRSHMLVTVSGYTENIVRKNLELGSRPLRIIHHGVPDSTGETLQRPEKIPDKNFLFSVGTFFERKNFHVLIPFLKKLEGYDLVLAGDYRNKYGEFVQAEILRLGLTGRVWLTGEISEAEKHWWYQHCHAFVFPSLSEGFGIPVIEAMHAGKPVFCSTLGSLPEMGGALAFYWENFDPEAMREIFVEKIKSFYKNSEGADRCKQYAESFSWRKAAEAYLGAYTELLQ